MATRWPTQTFTIEGSLVWGTLHTISTSATTSDEGTDEFLVPVSAITTAVADIRGHTPSIGQTLHDGSGRNWTIMAVDPGDSAYSSDVSLTLQLGVVVTDA